MRPVHGVVKTVKKQTLVIKLESGLLVEVPKAHGYGVGDVVNLAYDFTKGKIGKLLLPVNEEQEEGVTPVKETPKVGIIESIEESSGALSLVCDEIY